MDSPGGNKDQSGKPPGPKKGYELDDVLKEVLGQDLTKGDQKPPLDDKTPKDKDEPASPERIERVADLVEEDFEVVEEEDEPMGPKDEAIQNYIMDLEADLEEKITALEAERGKRSSLEAQVDKLKKDIEAAKKEDQADDTVQGYLSDLEADLKVKIDDLEKERKERERLEKELAAIRTHLDDASRTQDEAAKIKAELERTKATDEVEIARLETEQKRREQETESFKARVKELETELGRKVELIEEMRSRTSESEASLIDFKDRIKNLEHQLDAERTKGKDAHGRAETLASELQKMRDVLSNKVQEVEKVKTDLHSLEAMKKRLEEASNALDKESQERVRAESEIGKLRGNLTDIMQNIQNDLDTAKKGHIAALKDLEAERARKAELEKELASLRGQIDASASQTQKELLELKAEREQHDKEDQERQKRLEAEMANLNMLREELAQQKTHLEKEKASLNEIRARSEKEISERSSDYQMKDVRLRTEVESLKRERDELERRNYELAQRESRLVSREASLREKEMHIRGEMRSKALGLSSPTSTEPEEAPQIEDGKDEPVPLPEDEAVQAPEHAVEEATAEAEVPVSAAPRIWPPLGSHKHQGHDGGAVSDTRPRSGPVPSTQPEPAAKSPKDATFKMGLPRSYVQERPAPATPVKKEKRTLLWPSSAYEAEARVRNVAYEPPSQHEGADNSAAGKRRLIDNYMSAKSEPVLRPAQRRLHCVCGAEFWATTSPPAEGIHCPKCRRRLL